MLGEVKMMFSPRADLSRALWLAGFLKHCLKHPKASVQIVRVLQILTNKQPSVLLSFNNFFAETDLL